MSSRCSCSPSLPSSLSFYGRGLDHPPFVFSLSGMGLTCQSLLIEHHTRERRHEHSSRGVPQELVTDTILRDHDRPCSRRQSTHDRSSGGVVDDQDGFPRIPIGMPCEGKHQCVLRTCKEGEMGANLAGRGHAEGRMSSAQVNQARIEVEHFPVVGLA
jgi:hypothetical protein